MRIKNLILQLKVLHADDTKIEMLNSGIRRQAKFQQCRGIG